MTSINNANSTNSTITSRAESLLETTESKLTSEIVAILKEILPPPEQQQALRSSKEYMSNQIATIDFISKKTQALAQKINILFTTSENSKLEIKFKEHKLNANFENKKIDLEDLLKIQNAAQNILNTCINPKTSRQITDWNSENLPDLKKHTKNFIDSVNACHKKNKHAEFKIKEESKFDRIANIFNTNATYELCFPESVPVNVKNGVETILKKILINNPSTIPDDTEKLHFLDSLEARPYIEKFLYLNFKLKKEKLGTKKHDEIEEEIKGYKILILLVYKNLLLKFINNLVSNRDDYPYLSSLSGITDIIQKFVENIKKPTNANDNNDINSKLRCEIANTIKIHYIEGYLEKQIIEMIAQKMNKLKSFQRKFQSPENISGTRKDNYNFENLQNDNIERLNAGKLAGTCERTRALKGSIVWVYSGSGRSKKELLNPPDFSQSKAIPTLTKEETKTLNIYLLETEKLFSEHLGDKSGTILTNFRLEGYKLLKAKAQSDKTLLADETDIFEMDQLIFPAFAPTMTKIEKGETINEEEQSMLALLKNNLEKTNADILKMYSLESIGKFLFSLHRILNQTFNIGTLQQLKSILSNIDSSNITDVNNIEGRSSETAVHLMENNKFSLKWKFFQKICDENICRLEFSLRIDMPGINTNDEQKVINKIKVKFLKKESEIDITLLNTINTKIALIAAILKIMKFPVDSFVKKIA